MAIIRASPATAVHFMRGALRTEQLEAHNDCMKWSTLLAEVHSHNQLTAVARALMIITLLLCPPVEVGSIKCMTSVTAVVNNSHSAFYPGTGPIASLRICKLSSQLGIGPTVMCIFSALSVISTG